LLVLLKNKHLMLHLFLHSKNFFLIIHAILVIKAIRSNVKALIKENYTSINTLSQFYMLFF